MLTTFAMFQLPVLFKMVIWDWKISVTIPTFEIQWFQIQGFAVYFCLAANTFFGSTVPEDPNLLSNPNPVGIELEKRMKMRIQQQIKYRSNLTQNPKADSDWETKDKITQENPESLKP